MAVDFTKQMKRDFTILAPDIFPTHMELLQEVFALHGYHVEVLYDEGPAVIAAGLKYLHNDMCYPATCAVGQQLYALTSGKYDPHRVALIQFQTGGGCRASNYICADAQKLGRHIVVQGGTFYNDCVLRAFEMETGREVIRPRFAGLMGAYGAALYAANHPGHGVLSREELERFEHKVNRTVCQGCQNHCNLTVNLFPGGRRFLAGNR